MINSLCFKIYMILSAGYGIITVLFSYADLTRLKAWQEAGYDISLTVDSFVFASGITAICAGAVFMGMFVGREYSDGTIRNKLVVGHGRGFIYLANFLLCTAANLTALILNYTVTFALGIPLLGVNMAAGEIAYRILISVISCIALTSVLTLIPMLVGKKSAAVAALILSIFSMLFITSYVDSKLREPEYYGGGTELVFSPDGEHEFRESEPMKNPNYLEGEKRKVFEFFDEFLPFSQMYHVTSAEAPGLAKTAVYDIIILIAVTEAGILVFRKKDIK